MYHLTINHDESGTHWAHESCCPLRAWFHKVSTFLFLQSSPNPGQSQRGEKLHGLGTWSGHGRITRLAWLGRNRRGYKVLGSAGSEAFMLQRSLWWVINQMHKEHFHRRGKRTTVYKVSRGSPLPKGQAHQKVKKCTDIENPTQLRC